eukprot:UN15038
MKPGILWYIYIPPWFESEKTSLDSSPKVMIRGKAIG